MNDFSPLISIAMPLMLPNVDTDAIIPGEELIQLSKTGLGPGLFASWRYIGSKKKERVPNPEFVLNNPRYKDAKILLAGPNFACGSSREPAAWALRGWGFRCLIAPSFGSIFYSNCFKNGLLPIVLPIEKIEKIAAQAEDPKNNPKVSVDLAACVISTPGGDTFTFGISDFFQMILLDGLNPIEAVLRYQEQIVEFQKSDGVRRPWIYSA